MIHFLYDQPLTTGRFKFIEEYFSERGKQILFHESPNTKSKLLNWFIGCINILYKSHKNDVVICWYDFQAIILFWLSFISFKSIKIVCINILLKDKNTWKNKFTSLLYKKTLQSNRFIASVTSTEYGNHLMKRFNTNKPFFLLHDVFNECSNNKILPFIPNSVFCGGKNGRDWNFIIKVAKLTPHISYHLIMTEAHYLLYKKNLPSNIHVLYDIPLEVFLKVLEQSQLVAIPLDTEAPAGLIVFFQAAMKKKLIITTDTMRGILLPNNTLIWSEKIKERMAMQEENAEISENLFKYLQNECSEIKYANGIYKMVELITKCRLT